MTHPESAPATRTRTWVSFLDDDGDEWMFDLTFLTSSWTCIFGRGCPGVRDEPAPELEHGCCSHGAHFSDDDDLARVAQAASRLTDDSWQHRREAQRRGGPFKEHAGSTVSRTIDGACIFLNRPGFGAGSGCALHSAALQAGERPLDWKPEVCWQLPLRLTFHTDENERTVHSLRAWDREDWGVGGEEFHWWCTEASTGPSAFVADRPVYREMRDEIVAMIGEQRYQQLVAHIESTIDPTDSAVSLRDPVLKSRM
jgi:hypothetical protein